MPTKEDQYDPSDVELQKFEIDILGPAVSAMETEGVSCSPIEFCIVVGGIIHRVKSSPFARSRCLVSFYKTFTSDRQVVRSSLRLLQIDPKTGFSGIDIKGQLKNGSGSCNGKTNIYNKIEFGSV